MNARTPLAFSTAPKDQDALLAGPQPTSAARQPRLRETVCQFVRADHVRFSIELVDDGPFERQSKPSDIGDTAIDNTDEDGRSLHGSMREESRYRLVVARAWQP